MLERRTDLALEAAQTLRAGTTVEGVESEETVKDGVSVTVVKVRTPEAARRVGKPVGRYVTLDLGAVRRREKEGFSRACRTLAEELAKLVPGGMGTVLVVGLGNRAITPDAIGPLVHDHLLVTRHLVEQLPQVFGSFRPLAAVSAGVLGTTGMESVELVRSVVSALRPDCVIAVDALAAGNMKRLCTTVQLTDTGIAPGSGVGNCRKALTKEALGVPVIAVGVPTVVDVNTLARDVLEEAGKGELEPGALAPGGALSQGGAFVTTRDIDERVAECGKLIGYAIDLAVQKGLSLEDVEGLVE